MVLHVGLDDTDAPDGMCTTYVALRALLRLRELGLDAVGYPRLVRLNPNAPWKTRGNGALYLRVGHGRGRPRSIGMHRGEPIPSYPRGEGAAPSPHILDALEGLVLSLARLDCPGTNPGLVVGTRRPPPGLYWRAVREFLDPRDVLPLARTVGHAWFPKAPRGIVGATAAMAWRPRDRTYELLAFRHPRRWGTRRRLDGSSVARMDAAFPSTFNNVEPSTGGVAIAPHSPCPVLLGIRGDRPEELPLAFDAVEAHEEPLAWLVLETNQGTDDHVVAGDLGSARAGQSLRARATVAARPRTLPGGHVVVALRPGGLPGVAYEPSKGFRRIVASLEAGDLVTVWGSVRAEPPGLNLERIAIERLARVMIKVENPICTHCGKHMKSLGKAGGYRCLRCGRRAGPEAAAHVPMVRDLQPGMYEPPVTARRHLAKPLKRMA